MKRDRQIVEDRQQNILKVIRQQKEAKVEDLAEMFGVSLMTVRRDLQYLEDAGLITRFYGGAAAVPEGESGEKELVAQCRSSIGRYAATLVDDGDSIFINGSSTALGMLPYLDKQNLHIFTNNGLAVTVPYSPGIDLVVTGGNVQGKSGILTGDNALINLISMHADKAFIGCTGISSEGELLCGIPNELPINETMIEHSDSYYILADHTKIGVSGNYASWHLEKTGTVITDMLAPGDVVDQLWSIGMTVIRVK